MSSGRQHQVPSPSTVRRQYEEDRLQQEKEQLQSVVDLQPSLFHEYYQQQSMERIENNNENNYLSDAWNIPPQAEMKRRLTIRQDMLEETLSHRRNTFKQTTFVKNGRNVVNVLQDRSVCGSTKRASYYYTNSQQVKDRSNRLGSYQAESSEVAAETNNQEAETNASSSSSTSNNNNNNNSFPFPASDTVTKELRTFMEYASVTRYEAGYFKHLGGQDGRAGSGEDGEEEDTTTNNNTTANAAAPLPRRPPPPRRPASSKAVSTISIAFSPDGSTQASTHGDHTVKITETSSGELLKQLVGHPRTPWTVKYHPIDGTIVASGCLGHQVRVWHWPSGSCLQMIRLEFAIISLSFHPTGQVLAVANGTRLHFWATPVFGESKDGGGEDDDKNDDNDGDASDKNRKKKGKKIELSSNPPSQAPASSNNGNNPQPQDRPRGVLTEVEQRHMLRCVHFLPDGNSIIVGGVNPNSAQNRRQQPRGGISGGGMSFYLRLWDFDLQAALHPGEHSPTRNSGLRRRAISNPRTFVPRALLYNDGGFDVSPDGKTLCACAEYWLPDGIENATQLMHQNYEDESDSDSDDEDEPTQIPPEKSNSMDISGHSNAHSPPRPPLPHSTPQSSSSSAQDQQRRTPTSSLPRTPGGFNPTTPEATIQPSFPLSPPSPPGRRFAGGLRQEQGQQQSHFQTPEAQTPDRQPAPPQNQPPQRNQSRGTIHSATAGSLPPPPAPPGINRPGLSTPVNSAGGMASQSGRFVPHVVTISLDTAPFLERTDSNSGEIAPNATGTAGISGSSASSPGVKLGIPGRGEYATSQANGGSETNATRPHCRKRRPRLGQLLEACPLDGAKASAVTCVKFSPSTDFCLIGYGVREPVMEDPSGNQYHPVTALYRIRGGMTHVSTMLSGDDDVNIARFHPDAGYGFVYGTKQGRVRVMSPRPWNYYNC